MKVSERELSKPKTPWEPRAVFLFSGHMIDAPGRAQPRFPPDKEQVAAEAINTKLIELGAGPDDAAICGGACGGDLLFAEASLRMGLRLWVHIPFDIPQFLKESVRFAGSSWQDRFFAVKEHEKTHLLMMPEVIGDPPKGVDPYVRDNLWQLYSALAWGPEKVHFICLWNGQTGDGPGGPKHMYETVGRHAGKVYHLNTTELW